MYFLIADELLIFDRVRQTVTVLVNAIIEDGTKPEDVYEEAVDEVESLVSLLEQPTEHRAVTLAADPPDAAFESNMEKDVFLANVAKSKEYIRAGDIIQVVGSQRFSTAVKADPLDVYRAVRSINPSPYMFLLELDGFSLVGASPEIHVRCEEGEVQIRPIAGTRPRGSQRRGRFGARKRFARRPQRTRRARHACGPRPQRYWSGMRIRQRASGRPHDHRALQPRDAHRLECHRQTY